MDQRFDLSIAVLKKAEAVLKEKRWFKRWVRTCVPKLVDTLGRIYTTRKKILRKSAISVHGTLDKTRQIQATGHKVKSLRFGDQSLEFAADRQFVATLVMNVGAKTE
ncbi:hypothetical protein AVEN_196648-1 [Araneus ventricosus]|uniref:Uncharacterized protein n=1 Tax=Araneus ventricosus TaxID=182803 RepID=A0A4Y2E336_ARAVE|nr:hypothetical protein AVEN_196648-1 [Araneus ventricosus]